MGFHLKIPRARKRASLRPKDLQAEIETSWKGPPKGHFGTVYTIDACQWI